MLHESEKKFFFFVTYDIFITFEKSFGAMEIFS